MSCKRRAVTAEEILQRIEGTPVHQRCLLRAALDVKQFGRVTEETNAVNVAEIRNHLRGDDASIN